MQPVTAFLRINSSQVVQMHAFLGVVLMHAKPVEVLIADFSNPQITFLGNPFQDLEQFQLCILKDVGRQIIAQEYLEGVQVSPFRATFCLIPCLDVRW